MSILESIGRIFRKEEFDKTFRKNLAELKKGKRKHEHKFQFKKQKEFLFPEVKNAENVDIKYDLIPPFSSAHIYWDKSEKELIYQIKEPKLDKNELQIFSKIKQAIESNIEMSYSELETEESLINYLEHLVDKILSENEIEMKKSSYLKLMYFVFRDFAGFNEIEPLIRDPYIEDIGCDGVNVNIFIVHSKLGSIKTNLIYKEEDKLRSFVVKLAERSGKYISYAEPLLDGTLPDGSRVNASFSRDVTSRGPTFSIRKFHAVPFSSIDLLDLKTCNEDILAYLWLALHYRRNILITGGTDVGKTTFLNTIVAFIPPEDKIVSIEDTRELQIPHENWIPSVARPSYNLSGRDENEITMFHLLKESFRQNPDYVIVGEVRGEEASVLFQGMASGHSSMATIHASSPSAVVKRLITPPINLSPSLVETLDIIILMTRAREKGKSARRVKSIHEVQGITENQNLRTNELFAWVSIDDSIYFKGIESSKVLDEIRKGFGMSSEQLKEEFRSRKKVIKYMNHKSIRKFEDVAKIVSAYYRDRKSLLDRINKELPMEKQEEEVQRKPEIIEENSVNGVSEENKKAEKLDGKTIKEEPDHPEPEKESTL